jgi:hypothetical protein
MKSLKKKVPSSFRITYEIQTSRIRLGEDKYVEYKKRDEEHLEYEIIQVIRFFTTNPDT